MKIRSLFRLKDKSKSQSCVIYQEGTSSNDVNIKYILARQYLLQRFDGINVAILRRDRVQRMT